MCCYYQDKVERICKIYHLAELTNSILQNQTNKQRVHVETLQVLMESRGGAPVVYGLSRPRSTSFYASWGCIIFFNGIHMR